MILFFFGSKDVGGLIIGWVLVWIAELIVFFSRWMFEV